MEPRIDSSNTLLPNPNQPYSPPASPLWKGHAQRNRNADSPQYLSPLPQPLPRAIQYLSIPGAFEDAPYESIFGPRTKSVSPLPQSVTEVHHPMAERTRARIDDRSTVKKTLKRLATPHPHSGFFSNENDDQILPFKGEVVEGELVPRPSRPSFGIQSLGRENGKEKPIHSPSPKEDKLTITTPGQCQCGKSSKQEEVLEKEKQANGTHGASPLKSASKLSNPKPPARLASCPQFSLHPGFQRTPSHNSLRASPLFRGPPELRHDTISPPSPAIFSHHQQNPHHQPRNPPPSLRHPNSPSPSPYHTWPSPNPTTPAPTPGPESMMFPTIPSVQDPLAQRIQLNTPSSDFYDLSEYRAFTPRFRKPGAPRMSALSLRGGYHDPRTGGFARLGSRTVWWRDGRCVDVRERWNGCVEEDVEARVEVGGRKRGCFKRFGMWVKKVVRGGGGTGSREKRNDEVIGDVAAGEVEGNEQDREHTSVERDQKKVSIWKNTGKKFRRAVTKMKS